MSAKVDPAALPWTGRTREYDIIKEGFIAVVVVFALTISLALVFSSPDDKSLTFKGWAASNSENFYGTAVQELAGTSESAGYGAPYNNASDGLNMGPLWLQKWAGVHHPIDAPNDFVITPLHQQEQPADVATALTTWDGAGAGQRTAWATTYDLALSDASGVVADVPAGDYGPVPTLAKGLTSMAASGALDGILLAQGDFFATDSTKQILFFGDGGYLDDAGTKFNLQGGTWGMMNETGRYPGQAWLWLYSFWYQITPFNDESSQPLGANADAYIMAIMGLLSAGLIFIPFIPGVRSLPRRIPIQRLTWKQYYRKRTSNAGSNFPTESASAAVLQGAAGADSFGGLC